MLPHLATALRDAREKAGKKRSHAAAAADHDQSAITRFEKVKAWPRNPDQFVNAYAEVLGDEKGATCVAFLERAVAWFADRGVEIERILTDNGNGYRSRAWKRLCVELGVRHTRTRPYHPATNGKVERFNRTLLDEWAYARTWTSDAQRARTFDRWLHRYNHHRYHTAIGGSPTSRVTNLAGHNS